MRPPPAGLCDRCVHRRLVTTRRSVFVLCLLSRTDGRFPRYPPLPVAACAGFDPAGSEPPPGAGGG